MRVLENTPDRLSLRGVPGGRLAMVAATVIGLVITAAMLAFAAHEHRQANGFALAHLPLLLGLVIGQALFWTGAVTLAVGRVALVLDRPANEGRFDVVSPIVDAGKPCRFRLDEIAHLRVESREEGRPRGPNRREMDATVVRLRLLLVNPRRAVTLDETQNGNTARIDALAEVVARWLGQEVER